MDVTTDEAGSEFGLVILTRDNLALRFLLNAETTEALATGLVATLAEHGKQISLPRPGVAKH